MKPPVAGALARQERRPGSSPLFRQGAFVMSDAMSENVAKLIGPYWLRLAGLDITRQHLTSAEMPIDMDLQVLSTTSRTVQSQTGSQEVRGFESLRLHREYPGHSGSWGWLIPRSGGNLGKM